MSGKNVRLLTSVAAAVHVDFGLEIRKKNQHVQINKNLRANRIFMAVQAGIRSSYQIFIYNLTKSSQKLYHQLQMNYLK